MQGKVLHFESHTTAATVRYMIGDYVGGITNPNDIPDATANTVLSMLGKGNGLNGCVLVVRAAGPRTSKPFRPHRRRS